jgi:hypothetical protein
VRPAARLHHAPARPSSPATTCFSSPDPNAAGSVRPGGAGTPVTEWSSRARCAGSCPWGEPRGSTSTPQRGPIAVLTTAEVDGPHRAIRCASRSPRPERPGMPTPGRSADRGHGLG